MYRKMSPGTKKWIKRITFVIEIGLVILLAFVIFRLLFGSLEKATSNEALTGDEIIQEDLLVDNNLDEYHNDIIDIEMLEENASNYQYRINYPVFTQKEINQEVLTQIQEMKDIFLMEENNKGESTTKTTFLVNCESYLFGEKIATVVFHTYKGKADDIFQDEGIFLSIYDLENETILKQQDIFYEGFEHLLSPLVVNYFKEQEELRDYTETQLFKGNTKALPGNFSLFTLAEDEVHFYFRSGTIFPAELGIQKVVFSRDLMEPLLRFDKDGLEKPLPTEPETEIIEESEELSSSEPETEPPTEPTPAASPETEPPMTLEPATASVELDPNRPMIAFTFDDGPYSPVTDRILDVLEAHGQKATFFVMGNRVQNYPQTLRRIYENGNQLGNHSFNHKNFQNLSEHDMLWQLTYTNDLIDAIIGVRTDIVRVPYGAYQGQVTSVVKYPIIQWNVDTEDWRTKDATAIVDEVRRTLADGNIVLMHDLYPATAEAMEILVPELVAMGYQLVTINDLFAAKGIPLEPGRVYYKGS